ncbi:MAG TPA: GAF domain-containing sensor histidine kinase [Chryseolinea sp.]|nr:GAF domain-containing sensor histidine kinase [Chryseolinea sp.]
MSALEIEKLSSLLAESNRKMEIFRKVSFELNKLVNLPEKLQTILAILDEQFGMANSMILIPDHDKQVLTVFAGHGYDASIIGEQVAFGQGLIGLAAVRKKHINLTGIRRKQHYLATVSNEGDLNFVKPIGLSDAESQVAIPLLANDELVAVLMAESRNFCVYDQSDENFLITLAQSLAVSIQNSMLYDSMEKKIKERTAELQHLNNTKDKFFSIISHDLRGPVTSFQSLTRLFSYYNKEGQSDKFESLCSKVEQSVDTLNHLLENLLDWSLSQTNGIQCSFEVIQLREFIQTIVDIYQPNLIAKEIELSLNADNTTCIRGDRHTLATVFRNLISNAIKFTPRNGSIRISSALEDEKVRIELRDTGVGMDCRRLLNAFQLQGQRSTFGTEKEKGTGLGLVLVKEFTELNEGTIDIQSDPGSGTIITLLLPNGKPTR